MDSSGEKFITTSRAKHVGYFSDVWKVWVYSSPSAQRSATGDSV